MDKTEKTLLEIGKIVATHGLRGDMKARPSSGDPELLLNTDYLYVRSASGVMQSYALERCSQHKGQVLLRFKNYDSINQVESFIGSPVFLPAEDFPDLDENEHYWADLEGLQVIDKDLGDLGCLVNIYTTAAHDIYLVKGPYGEVQIPAVQQFIVAVDFDKRLMQVELPEGLVETDNDI
jgi:16S rRNA processing protein RimM